ncbi:aspartate aminotransferase family protein [Aquimarina agarivorans]|uniref:aspartate aminotransferase family protein n=1 Tax=Aquimarina agarivorans TaxID=980584 RepID=UPI000248EDA6|nr:aminotransferase class III-fold pyridoxal phosphate-dependent enzyme [Aquimarina agarivorans]
MKKDFFTYQAQTTPFPLAMEVSHASGSYIYDTKGKAHLDFVAGVSACSLGHCHPNVVEAIKAQVDRYLHVMVYGEYIQQPAVELTKLIAKNLPDPLNKTYLTNSGTEAIEGALKLARRVTGRSQIIAAKKAYHGNTMGSLSVMGYEERKQAFRPLIPDIHFIEFNNENDLSKITTQTAGVILETIQGGAGFIQPKNGYLTKVKKRCDQVGALLILDEIQPGIGRTGKLFGFQNYNVIPDVVVTGKGLGGGLPVGAFTASEAHMDLLMNNPMLGHITTFGGNPIIAASCLATLQTVISSDLIPDTLAKEKLFRKLLVHPLINEIRGIGLMLIILLPTAELATEVVMKCKEKGLILFFLLFEKRAVRITPPLTISDKEIEEGCQILLEILNEFS